MACLGKGGVCVWGGGGRERLEDREKGGGGRGQDGSRTDKGRVGGGGEAFMRLCYERDRERCDAAARHLH